MPDLNAYVPDWEEFQHYTKRNPPWIKLHMKLLKSYRFKCLHVASKALAPCIWLLAAENDGHFCMDIDYLEFRLPLSRKEIETGLKDLLKQGYICNASNALAPCKQDAMLETETETETESKTETETEADIRPEDVEGVLSSYRLFASDNGLTVPSGTQRQRDALKRSIKRYGLEQWNDVISRCRASSFLQGRETKWSVTLDWLCKPANFEKVLDGNYKNRQGKPTGIAGAVWELQDHQEAHGVSGGEPLPDHLQLTGRGEGGS